MLLFPSDQQENTGSLLYCIFINFPYLVTIKYFHHMKYYIANLIS